MADSATCKLREKPTKITIIPNWADLDLVSPSDRSENVLLSELGLIDRFVIEYAGNMGRTHGLESLWQVAQELAHKEGVHFLFIGSGAKRNWLDQAIRAKGMINMTLLPRVPQGNLATMLNACDVAIISFVPCMAGISVPSRMYNIMAAGKPIIAVADDHSELALVVKEERIGWVVPPGDIDRIIAAILEAKSNPTRLAEMGQRARQVAETKYSFERVIESYHSLIQGLGDTLGS